MASDCCMNSSENSLPFKCQNSKTNTKTYKQITANLDKYFKNIGVVPRTRKICTVCDVKKTQYMDINNSTQM